MSILLAIVGATVGAVIGSLFMHWRNDVAKERQQLETKTPYDYALTNARADNNRYRDELFTIQALKRTEADTERIRNEIDTILSDDGEEAAESVYEHNIGMPIRDNGDGTFSPITWDNRISAEENAALYIANVLHQYGWGMDRLKRHYDWSGKDCPHKMHATGTYQAFRNRVQAHLNAIKKGSSASKPATPKPTPKPTPAKKKPAAKKSKTPRTIGSWQTNKINGAQYIRAEGTFTVTANDGIISRFHNPSTNAKYGGLAKKGWSTKYDYLVRAKGYVWIQYKVNGKGPWKFLPYNSWNSKTGAVGKTAWGTSS